MKKNILISVLCMFLWQGAFAGTEQTNAFFSKADAFFKKHVKNGLVDYKAIKQNPTELNALVSQISTMKLSEQKGNTHKAFYINSYNILVIKGIVNNLPTKSPLDIAGFFDKKKYKVAGEMMILNDVENKKIRAIYNDARIHFVLVCAAKGCPKIVPYAYKPATLDRQLEERTKVTLNDSTFIRVKANANTVLVSEIFKWYKQDFVTGGKSIVDYVNQYRKTKISTSYKQDYYPYNWQLNIQ
ncbi:MAG: DUF547 domain-containing protein [Cytophagales bacterium]|nr:DUF547 domain-containing protein [Cytophagales bacterium]